jgi:hypothetical protein
MRGAKYKSGNYHRVFPIPKACIFASKIFLHPRSNAPEISPTHDVPDHIVKIKESISIETKSPELSFAWKTIDYRQTPSLADMEPIARQPASQLSLTKS